MKGKSSISKNNKQEKSLGEPKAFLLNNYLLLLHKQLIKSHMSHHQRSYDHGQLASRQHVMPNILYHLGYDH